MLRVSRLFVAAALTLAVAGSASAAATLAPLFTVPGLINTGPAGTFFACTNTDATPTTVGIEVFNQAGTQIVTAASNAVSLSPQATILFGTSSASGFVVDAALNPGGINKGSANIWTTSKKIACTAFVADPVNTSPTFAYELTIVAKGKQKGD